MLKGKKIGIIGVGNIGSAIIRGILGTAGRIPPKNIIVNDIDKKKSRAISRELSVISVADNIELGRQAGIIILAAKPHDIEEILKDIADLQPGKLIICIAAGIKTSYIEKMLPGQVAVVRAMPNMPALIGEGMTAISAGRFAGEEELQLTEAIFSAMGETVRISEDLMDTATAVSGSGPAYFFLMMEALIEAGIAGGLSPQVAHRLVIQTAYGAAKMTKESEKELFLLREEVTSPGGTTEAGVAILEKKRFKDILTEAVAAGAARSKKLSRK
ncbi:MAG: Pyrroline-5-carboxylate reductase [Firmicutes bacterium]|nr:Pyrroline-5-carboxylate reductase [Bacillota bacterium]